jgi:hypothetical protein
MPILRRFGGASSREADTVLANVSLQLPGDWCEE